VPPLSVEEPASAGDEALQRNVPRGLLGHELNLITACGPEGAGDATPQALLLNARC